jgi:uncharacterized glyoxalase superfamily protein PhnB
MPASTNYPNAPYLTVADLRRSIRFYVQLGFTLGSSWPDAKKPKYASLVLDRQVVMLGSSLSEKEGKEMGMEKAELRRVKKDHKAFKKHRHGLGVQLYLRVPDPDAHHRSARRRSVEVLRPPATHFYGIRDYVVADPDGYQLVFFAPAPSDELRPAPRRSKRGKVAGKATRRAEAPVSGEAPARVPEPLLENGEGAPGGA